LSRLEGESAEAKTVFDAAMEKFRDKAAQVRLY
jgi:hypothetical protein